MSKGKKNSEVKRSPSPNKHGLYRAIPSHIKLEIRKRCGFGCVICGLGIYEYEHFSPEFKDATSHNPDGITLLCPNHHAKKTKGILSRGTVEKFNKSPKALSRGFVKEEFDLYSRNLKVVLGTITFEETPILLQIDDEPILSIAPSDEEDDAYYISATLRNSSGSIIMEIEKNEWKTTTGHWDCKTIGDRIQIRNAPGEIELIVRQVPPHEIHIERLTMIHRGYKIELHEKNFTRITAPDGGGFEIKDFLIGNYKVGLMLQSESGGYRESVGYIAKEGGGRMGLGVIKSFNKNGTQP